MENLLNVLPLLIFNKIISQLVAMILLSCYSDSDLAQHLDQLGCSTSSTWLCRKLREYVFHGFLLGKCHLTVTVRDDYTPPRYEMGVYCQDIYYGVFRCLYVKSD